MPIEVRKCGEAVQGELLEGEVLERLITIDQLDPTE